MSEADLEERVESLEAAVDELEREHSIRRWPSERSEASREQRARIKNVKQIVALVEAHDEDGASLQDIHSVAAILDLDHDVVRDELEKLRRQGEIYEPDPEVVKTT